MRHSDLTKTVERKIEKGEQTEKEYGRDRRKMEREREREERERYRKAKTEKKSCESSCFWERAD